MHTLSGDKKSACEQMRNGANRSRKGFYASF